MEGYGCCFPGNWESIAPLEEDERQTSNRAELKAAIAAVLEVTHRPVIFGDSKYVLDGVQGEVYQWCRNGWCGPKGPIPNSMPWEALLKEGIATATSNGIGTDSYFGWSVCGEASDPVNYKPFRLRGGQLFWTFFHRETCAEGR